MKEYNSIPRFIDDKSLLGQQVYAFNKLDGQNFRAKYNPKTKQFVLFGSRTQLVDENNENFSQAIKLFHQYMENELLNIISENSAKNKPFNGISELTFFFEFYGDNSFAGFHDPNDKPKLALIDVFLKKKGYIEPKIFDELFCQNPNINTPQIIMIGKLNMDFVNDIVNNDWTSTNPLFPNVKEGVVVKRTTLLKGQRLPMCKIKTNWWINKLHNDFEQELWDKLE